MADKDYYSILGVPKNSSADDIKRSFRKLAQEHHPDKGGDAERFKELNEAYSVLSDPQKRAVYDKFGHAGFAHAGGGGFSGSRPEGAPFRGGFEDIFTADNGGTGGFRFSFGGGLGDLFEDFFGEAFSQVQVEVPISLTQAVLGDTLRFQTQHGDTLEFRIPPGAQDGQSFRFRGKGNPHKRGRGDLLVTLRIKMPGRLNKDQRRLFEELRQAGL